MIENAATSSFWKMTRLPQQLKASGPIGHMRFGAGLQLSGSGEFQEVPFGLLGIPPLVLGGGAAILRTFPGVGFGAVEER